MGFLLFSRSFWMFLKQQKSRNLEVFPQTYREASREQGEYINEITDCKKYIYEITKTKQKHTRGAECFLLRGLAGYLRSENCRRYRTSEGLESGWRCRCSSLWGGLEQRKCVHRRRDHAWRRFWRLYAWTITFREDWRARQLDHATGGNLVEYEWIWIKACKHTNR